METSSILPPLLFGPVPSHYEALRRFSNPSEPADVVWVPPPPEPNFRIDDLLDFSNGELCEELPDGSNRSGEVEEPDTASGAEKEAEENEQKSDRSGGMGQEVSQQAESSGLCVPSDELADELEWLSAFNEDSSYSGDRHLASLVSSGSLGGSKDDENPRLHDTCKFQSASPISVLEPSGFFSANGYLSGPSSRQPVPSRARSKRPRTGARIWSLDSLMPTLFVTTRLSQDSPVFFGSSPQSREPSYLPSSKKVKKQSMAFKPQVEAPIRRCSHCLVQKTPQWRAGPMGPKTLCNACGVRYKSGRLVPEYRPAGSPTFVSEVHSNSHKKILEMRRMKEMEEYVSSPLKDSCGSSHKEEEGNGGSEDSDCFSQSESYEEDSMADKRGNLSVNCRSQDDPNGSICSENEDVACSIRREEDDSLGWVKCH